MKLAGVRNQLAEAARLLGEAQARTDAGDDEAAYREALASRNELFHATRALAAARSEDAPEVPAVGIPGGDLGAFTDAQRAIGAALAVEDDLEMVEPLAHARLAYARVLGVLRQRAFDRRLGRPDTP